MEEFHIQWHITNRCNLRCKHCYQDSFTDSGELTWLDLKKVCDNLIKAMRLKNRRLTVSLTGGEPFLKDELFDIINYLSPFQEVDDISIITNGVLIDKYIWQLVETPSVKDIYISLEGVDAGINDSLRGPGVFSKVLKNIKLLKKRGFRVFIMFTLLQDNFDQVKKLFGFCKAYGLDGYIIERFIPLGQSRKIKEKVLSPLGLEKVYKNICDQHDLDYSQSKSSCPAIKVDIGKDKTDFFAAECIVANEGCAVMPDASVFPCRRFPLSIGNLLDKSLVQIWDDSSVLNNVRKKESNPKERVSCKAFSFSLCGDYLIDDFFCWANRDKDILK